MVNGPTPTAAAPSFTRDATAPNRPTSPQKPGRPQPTRPRVPGRSFSPWILGLAALIVIAGVGIGVLIYVRPAPEGVVTINTRPAGADVTIDGKAKGKTPLQVTLGVGDHTIVLPDGASWRTIPVTIKAGMVVSENVDLTAPAPTFGRLDISSTPAGAHVTVDHTPQGTTPVVLDSIAPGPHTVVLSDGDNSVTQTVEVTAGATANVVASITPTGPGGGWVSFKAPFELQVLEDGKLIGTTSTDRIMLSPGRHEFKLTNDTFGYSTTLAAVIEAGKTVSPGVPIPTTTVSINAQPWADVWLDGKAIGTTPLANLSVPIGNHEIVWKHPQLGERHRTVAFTQTPMHLGLDFK